MTNEERYLTSALKEAQSFVIVLGLEDHGARRKKIRYISPNAEVFGINVEALMKGYKAPEDYIHFEDRSDFIDALNYAYTDRKSFSYALRMIGDDGVLRDIVCSINIDPGEATDDIVFLARTKDSRTSAVDSDIEFNLKFEVKMLMNSKVDEMFSLISELFGLYSSIVDMEGNRFITAGGSGEHMGTFYDMFENPMYTPLFENIKSLILSNSEEPIFLEMDDGIPESRISAAPIKLDDKVVGIWLLCAYDTEGAVRLKEMHEMHLKAAEDISDHMYRYCVSDKLFSEILNLKARIKVETERHRILEKFVDDYSKDYEVALHDVLQNIGECLNTDFVAFYRADDTGKLNVNDYWYAGGYDSNDVERFVNIGIMACGQESMENRIVDNSNITNKIRVDLFRGDARAAIVVPFEDYNNAVGRIAIIEKNKERVWHEEEISFVNGFANVVKSLSCMSDVKVRYKVANTTYLDMYNNVNVPIFIKDKKTGIVLFSNDCLNQLLGYNFMGKDSRVFIPEDNRALFSDMGDIPDTDKVEKSKWQRYLKEYNAVVDIIEADVDWITGETARMYIINKAEKL